MFVLVTTLSSVLGGPCCVVVVDREDGELDSGLLDEVGLAGNVAASVKEELQAELEEMMEPPTGGEEEIEE